MIKADNLTKSYGDKVAVDDLSLKVETGKVTEFLGPNGAGKSTTMRLMLGLDVGRGTTTFDNKPLSEYDTPSKVVGILLEAKAFHPTRSARSHLRILAQAGSIPLERVDEVLEIVGLTDVAKKGPGKFSLGMSQRLGLAAAILGKPKYLMLDEPANGLDPEGIAWLRQFLKDYADAGNGVFVSSHLLSEMAQMADNVVVIGRGRMIVSTTVKDLVSSNSQSGVLVRSSKKQELEAALNKAKLSFGKQGAGFIVSGVSTDKVGKLAFDAKLPLLELTAHSASLEEVFLQITSGSEEYQGKGGKK